MYCKECWKLSSHVLLTVVVSQSLYVTRTIKCLNCSRLTKTLVLSKELDVTGVVMEVNAAIISVAKIDDSVLCC